MTPRVIHDGLAWPGPASKSRLIKSSHT